MAFTESSVNFSLTQTELDEVFRQSYEGSTIPSHASAETAAIFRQASTTHSAVIGKVHKGPGLFSKIGETEAIPTYDAKVSNKWTVTMSTFAEGIYISKDLFDDDMFSEWEAQVRELAIMARRTQDDNAFKLYRNAFTTTLTPDGVSLINIAHPLIGGGTQSNQIVTADISGATTSALTTSAYNVATRRLATMKSQAGVPLQCVSDTLLVPTALYFTAVQIARSALVPENGLNGINPFTTDYSINVYQSVWLDAANGGSDTAWFVLDSKRHAIYRYTRQGLQTNLRDWTYSNNRTFFYQANFREELIAKDFIGIVGATGLA